MWIKPGLDLTYCTNIHAGESWSEVQSSLVEFALPLKQHLSPEAPFGLGLRLSAIAAAQLIEEDQLAEFKSFLKEHQLYVALINGFPFGSFHGDVVKERVFAPDWSTPERLHYTSNMASILGRLLPSGMDGGISTIPLSYKPWVQDRGVSWPSICRNIAVLAAELVRLRTKTGAWIHLDIEPEPNGLVETTEEIIEFFRGPLQIFGAPYLAEILSISVDAARQKLNEHVQVCFDVCHMTIQFEDAIASLRRLKQEGIGVGRLQISSALRVLMNKTMNSQALQEQLQPFSDCVYLHQVVERDAAGRLRRFRDLDDALANAEPEAGKEWRIHFHLPLFTEKCGRLLTTQEDNRKILAFALEQEVCSHLEVETYTWHVLPEALKVDMLSSIARELEWVLQQVPPDGPCIKP